MKACQPCILRMTGSCLAVGWVRGAWEASRSCVRSAFGRCGSRRSGRGGRRVVRAPFVPFGRSSRSACVTERSVGAYGVVGATRAGRSRVRCVWTPRDLGGDRARSGEIVICPRFCRDLPRLRSDRTSSLPIFGILEFRKVQGKFKTRLMKFGRIVFSRARNHFPIGSPGNTPSQ